MQFSDASLLCSAFCVGLLVVVDGSDDIVVQLSLAEEINTAGKIDGEQVMTWARDGFGIMGQQRHGH